MEEKFSKLTLSLVGLLLSLVLVAGSTFAWFAISTAPEVRGIQVSVASSSESMPFEFSITGTGNWTTLVNLSELMVEDNVLRPISTYDGESWFIPNYNAIGNISSFSLISETMLPSYVNTGDSDLNYFVYQDVFIRTVSTEADTFNIRLSNPADGADLQSEDSYGTYAIYAPTEDEDGNIVTNDAMSAFRIGFRFYTPETVEGETEPIYVAEDVFYIYEPNADSRSADLIALAEQVDTSESQVQYVYETDAATVTNALNYSSLYSEGVVYDTQVPIEADNANGFSLVTVGATPTETTLIQQRASSWDTAALSKLASIERFDSTCMDTIGAFLSTPPAMTTISTDEVKMVRIYFWVEGQDVDCWNQLVSSNVFANLEFTGSAVNVTATNEEN